MEGDEITKLEGIEVPAGFAGDEIGHEIPEDAPPQRAARAPTLLVRNMALFMPFQVILVIE